MLLLMAVLAVARRERRGDRTVGYHVPRSSLRVEVEGEGNDVHLVGWNREGGGSEDRVGRRIHRLYGECQGTNGKLVEVGS